MQENLENYCQSGHYKLSFYYSIQIFDIFTLRTAFQVLVRLGIVLASNFLSFNPIGSVVSMVV